MEYRCSQCGKTGVRLWREFEFVASNVKPLCFVCAGGNVDELLPALPVDGSYWCVSSAPHDSIRWWYGLAAVPGEPERKLPDLNPDDDPAVVRERLAKMNATRVDQYIQQTRVVVQATSTEQHDCWARTSSDSCWHCTPKDFPRMTWEQLNPAELRTIGHIQNRPICVSMTWARINGIVCCFWDGTSELVDYKMIEKYVRKLFVKSVSFTDVNNIRDGLRAAEIL